MAECQCESCAEDTSDASFEGMMDAGRDQMTPHEIAESAKRQKEYKWQLHLERQGAPPKPVRAKPKPAAPMLLLPPPPTIDETPLQGDHAGEKCESCGIAPPDNKHGNR